MWRGNVLSLLLGPFYVVLTSILPVFAVILTGFFAGKFKLFDQQFADGLLALVFYFALPALLFLKIVEIPPILIFSHDMSLFVIVIICINVVAYWLVWGFNRWILRKAIDIATTNAMCATIANSALLGIPILLALFGHSILLPSALVVIIVTLFSYIPSHFLLSYATKEKIKKGQGTGILKACCYFILRAPILWMPILAMVFSAYNWHIFYQVSQYLNYLQFAVVPCSLFAAGLSIAFLSQEKGVWKYVIKVSFLKLMVMLFIALLFVQYFNLSPKLAIIAIILSSIPTAKSVLPLTFAYNIQTSRVATQVALSSVLAIVTVTFWVVVTALLYPTYFAYFAIVPWSFFH